MIYLDNAATTLQKPAEVGEAVLEALGTCGGAGRGVHSASLAAGRAIFGARDQIARLFSAPQASCVAFTANATIALNTAIFGLARPGMRIVTTAASHNSVLRPLHALADRMPNITVEVARILPDGSIDWGDFERLCTSASLDLLVITHASNLTGDIYDIPRMVRLARQQGAQIILDSAQTAGACPIDFTALGVDVLCFTGHKALFGPQGTGGLVVKPDVEITPFMEGGSGTHSFELRHPRMLPESLEAGTLNAHGLAGLKTGAAFVEKIGVATIHQTTKELALAFAREIVGTPQVRVLGAIADAVGETSPHGESQSAYQESQTLVKEPVDMSRDFTGICAVDITSGLSSEVANMLASEFDICTRAGAHCAPLMHRALGTHERGAIRFSFSVFNTLDEVHAAASALKTCLERVSG